MGLGSLHRLGARVAVVVLVGRAIVVVCAEARAGSVRSPTSHGARQRTGLGDDKDVVATTERIREVGGRAEEDVRVAAGGLAGRRAVKVPLLQLSDARDGAIESLQEETGVKVGSVQCSSARQGCRLSGDCACRVPRRRPRRRPHAVGPHHPARLRACTTTNKAREVGRSKPPGAGCGCPIRARDMPRSAPAAGVKATKVRWLLTVVLQRSPPSASIQTYSAHGGPKAQKSATVRNARLGQDQHDFGCRLSVSPARGGHDRIGDRVRGARGSTRTSLTGLDLVSLGEVEVLCGSDKAGVSARRSGCTRLGARRTRCRSCGWATAGSRGMVEKAVVAFGCWKRWRGERGRQDTAGQCKRSPE